MKYNIENNIDFYQELYSSMSEDKNIDNDVNVDCEQIAKHSCMIKNVIKDCKKACGRCGGETVSNCYDRMEKCPQLARTRCNEQQIRINCMKSCKVCNK